MNMTYVFFGYVEVDRSARLAVIVGESRLYGLLGEDGAVDLDSRQTAERFDNGFVCHCEGFLDRAALDELRRHGRCRDSGAAAEGLELNVNDYVIFDLEEHLHDIAAGSVADGAYTVRVFDLAHVSRMSEMIHYFFTVLHGIIPFLLLGIARINGAHCAQACNDGGELFYNVVDVCVGVVMRERDAHGAVSFFGRQADREKHVRGLKRI